MESGDSATINDERFVGFTGFGAGWFWFPVHLPAVIRNNDYPMVGFHRLGVNIMDVVDCCRQLVQKLREITCNTRSRNDRLIYTSSKIIIATNVFK